MAASVLSCSNAKLTVTYPDELLKEAVKKMVTQDIGRLPVVDRLQPTRLVGYIGRSAIIQAQVKQLKDESFRESRWFSTS
jgi:CIC family chloride channel protein